MKKVHFLPQINGFGIEMRQVETYFSVPLVVFSCKDYPELGCALPESDAPVVGVLFESEQGYYTIHPDYINALALFGMRILFLDYKNCIYQLKLCDALLLPGGSFELPERYFSDAKLEDVEKPNPRAEAYIKCYKAALKKGKPVLGIGAGMQIIAAEAGLKLYRSQKYYDAAYSHNSEQLVAHHVDLPADTPFRKLFDDMWRIKVNSYHQQVLAPVRVQQELLGTDKLPLDLYGLATDGIPEAVGKMDKGILGVQWHPENFVAHGDETQKRIFSWFADKAREYCKNKKS